MGYTRPSRSSTGTVTIFLLKLLGTLVEEFDSVGDSKIVTVRTITYYLEEETEECKNNRCRT